jgi:hypothetical protein
MSLAESRDAEEIRSTGCARRRFAWTYYSVALEGSTNCTTGFVDENRRTRVLPDPPAAPVLVCKTSN